MCYRYSNAQEEAEMRRHFKSIGKVFRNEPDPGKKFSFYHTNGFGHEELPVITQEKPDEISYMYWGLVPAGTKSKADKEKSWKMGYTLNARSESIYDTWSFRNNIRTHRCLIPATGFFEWRDFGKEKFPYLIQVKAPASDDIAPFCFAGVYDHWVDKETGEVTDGFAIITTEANPMLKNVHVNLKRPDNGGRMPVILHEKDYDKWLDPQATEDEIEALMKPYEQERMQAYTISKMITKRTIDPNAPETLQFYPYPELGEEVAMNVEMD